MPVKKEFIKKYLKSRYLVGYLLLIFLLNAVRANSAELNNITVRSCAKICVKINGTSANFSEATEYTTINNAHIFIYDPLKKKYDREFQASEVFFQAPVDTYYFRQSTFNKHDGYVDITSGEFKIL